MKTNLQNSNEIFSYLRSINDLIKNPIGRELGYEKLKALEVETFNPGLQMYSCYLKGKYYSFLHRENPNNGTKHLEYASDYFGEIFQIAKENELNIKNPKYHFLNAHTKFQLSKYHLAESQRNHFYNVAKRLTVIGLNQFKDNESLIWLNNQFKE